MHFTVNTPSGRKDCHHQRQYGMSCAEYDALRARAGNRCEICGTPEAETPHRILFIDHDGRYGDSAVRGLLCVRCNGRLEYRNEWDGAFERNAIRYLHDAWFMRIVESTRDSIVQVPPPTALIRKEERQESIRRYKAKTRREAIAKAKAARS